MWPVRPSAETLTDVVPFVAVLLMGFVPSRHQPESSFLASQRWRYRDLIIVFGVITVINFVPIPAGSFTPGGPLWAIIDASIVLLIMVSVWAPVRWRHRRPWRALGFEPSTALYNALWALRIALGLGSAFAVLALWARRHSSGIHNAASVPLPTTSHGQLGDFLAWYVIAAVLGPIAEEMVFRGFAYGLLFRKFGPAGAAVASAALWAAGHSMRLSYGSAFKTLFLVMVGIVYAEVYRRRQSLFPTVAFHIVGNSASVLIRDRYLSGLVPFAGAWVGLWALSAVLFQVVCRSRAKEPEVRPTSI